MRLEKEIAALMESRGWAVCRQGGNHTIWQHKNGAKYTVPHRLNDTRVTKQNILRDLKRLEAK